MIINREIDASFIVNTLILLGGVIYGIWIFFDRPKIEVMPPRIVIFHSTQIANGTKVMAVSVDISMANLARPGVNAVFHDNNLRFVHSDGEFSLIWSAIHDVYVRESGQNLVLDTISQPTFFQILGGGIVSHRMDFVDTFCLNQSSSCEQEGRDFAGVLEIVDKDREVNIEIDLDFLNVATKNINCRINFSDLDMLLLVVNDWVAKKCKF